MSGAMCQCGHDAGSHDHTIGYCRAHPSGRNPCGCRSFAGTQGAEGLPTDADFHGGNATTALAAVKIGAQGNGARLTGEECAALLLRLGIRPKVVRVCGVDCHPGDQFCNGYCNDSRVKMPPLFSTTDGAA